MPLKITTSDTQRVKDQVRKTLEKLVTDKFVTVGFHAASGNHKNDGITNAQLGATLHFGAGNIPPRPFLDLGVDSGNQQYLQTIKEGYEKDTHPDQILNQIGVQAVSAVQTFMNDLQTPPNSAATIAIKGQNNPLIDNGELKQAVTYEIQQVKPSEGLQ